MANPQRGEVKFKAGDQEWTLVYSINALCELEAELGMGINEVVQLLSDPKKLKLSSIRAVLWAGLREYQPAVDIKQAGSIISDLKLPAALDLITKGFGLAFPEGEAKGVDPQVPAPVASPAGTGKPS